MWYLTFQILWFSCTVFYIIVKKYLWYIGQINVSVIGPYWIRWQNKVLALSQYSKKTMHNGLIQNGILS